MENDLNLAIKLLGAITILALVVLLVMIIAYFGYGLKINGKSKGVVLTTNKDIHVEKAELKDVPKCDCQKREIKKKKDD